MDKVSKKLGKLLREHRDRAWEAENRIALGALADKFDEWREGKLATDELDHAVHEYHDGIGREIWKRYALGDPGLALARAVLVGIIDRDSLPPEVLEHVSPLVRAYYSQPRSQPNEPGQWPPKEVRHRSGGLAPSRSHSAHGDRQVLTCWVASLAPRLPGTVVRPRSPRSARSGDQVARARGVLYGDRSEHSPAAHICYWRAPMALSSCRPRAGRPIECRGTMRPPTPAGGPDWGGFLGYPRVRSLYLLA